MRGAWFGNYEDAEEFAAAARQHAKAFEIDLHDPFEIYIQKRMLAVLQMDFVILPLSLPEYGSLWLLDLANKMDSVARIILRSRTDADPDCLAQLYDGVFRPEQSFPKLFDLIEANSTRNRDSKITHPLFRRVLATSSHFRVTADGDAPSLDEVLRRPVRELSSAPPQPFRETIPSPPTVRILFVAANPLTTTPLDIEEELRGIELEIGGVRHRDRVLLSAAHAARPDDLVRHVRRFGPTIVHFSGHGSEHGIIARTDSGASKPVAGSALARLFRDRGVRLVVLNSCFSDDQAKALATVIPAVIGTTSAVDDEAARRFSVAFYRAVGDGLSVGDAFRDAGDAVAVYGLDDVFAARGELGLTLLPRKI